MPTRRNWLLQTGPHITETYIPFGGDTFAYLISPESTIKKGDRVYLWLNYQNSIYGRGEVLEHPQIVNNPGLERATKMTSGGGKSLLS